MKGDFTRDLFDPTRHYSGVLMQQGRVQLDADWNAQDGIQRYRAEVAARDVIGASGGVAVGSMPSSSAIRCRRRGADAVLGMKIVTTQAMSMHTPPKTTAVRRFTCGKCSITRLRTNAMTICGITMKKLKMPM